MMFCNENIFTFIVLKKKFKKKEKLVTEAQTAFLTGRCEDRKWGEPSPQHQWQRCEAGTTGLEAF